MKIEYTHKLAEYLVGLSYEDLPQEVIDQAKKITLHTMGAAFASKNVHQTKQALKMATMRNGTPEATIWGSNNIKVSREDAAFANGTMSDVLDWEDCAWTGHPSAGAIPVAFTMTEVEKKTGKDYLTAVVAAYEGYHRIAMSEQPSLESIRTKKRMWGLTSWQIYSSSLAAAKVMGLNVSQTKQTMGASYYLTFAPGTKHATGLGTSDIYHFTHGFCARNGITAATIAQLGFENLYDALDGNNGAWNQVSDRVDWDWLDRDLGSRYYITETLLKHWPANMWGQGPIEAAMLIKQKYDFMTDDIVEMRLSPNIGSKMQGYHLTTRSILDAQFSIPYCICVYFTDPHAVGIDWFSEERRNDEKLIELTKKFKPMGNEVLTYELFDIFKQGDFPEVILEVDLKDGRTISQKVRYPKGHPRNNFSMEEEFEHFRLCCRNIMPKDQTEAIIDIVNNLENLYDFSELSRLMNIKE